MMPYSIRYRRDQWCVISDVSTETVSSHETRRAALDALALALSADPVLAALDWGEQRVLASAALRWHNRYGLGGSAAAILAAARLADPTPLSGDEVAWLDEITRAQPAHRSVSRDLAGRAWPRTAAVSKSRLRKLSRELAVIDQRLGDRLYAMSVTATRDALRRAGVKAVVRAKNRGKTAALITDGLTPAVMAAIGVSPDELLDRAFLSLQDEAEAQIVTSNRKRVKAIAQAYDLDPDEEADLEDDPQGDQRAKWAAALLAAGLLARARRSLAAAGDLARQTLTGITDTVQALRVPFADVRSALRVRDGWQQVQTITQGPNRTPEADADVTLLPPEHGSSAIDELLGKASGGQTFTRFYEWIHGYFGEPGKPFIPHLDLDGAQYDDTTRAEVLAADPSEWPFVAEYSVEDHEDCTCYEVVTYEPDEG